MKRNRIINILRRGRIMYKKHLYLLHKHEMSHTCIKKRGKEGCLADTWQPMMLKRILK